MQKPYKYTVIRKDNSDVIEETNRCVLLHELQEYVATEDPNIKVLKQTKEVYIDTRYEAKLRLYNYLTYTRKGLEVPVYRPFEGTNIGKTEPILNF